MKTTHTTTRRLLGAALLPAFVAGAAWGQGDEGQIPSLPRPPVQKVAGLETAKWKLVGAVADRPGPGDISPRSAVVERLYDNGSEASLYFSEAQPRRVGDDAAFIENACLGGPVSLTTVEFGMYVNPGLNAEAGFDAHVLFYNSIDPMGAPVNTDFLGGFLVEFREICSGAYTTGPIDVRPLLPKGIPIPDESFFVDIRFYQPGSTTVLSPRATPIFSGTGPRLGGAADVFWTDSNGNGIYDYSDARSFGGTPHLANLYLLLDGIVSTGCAADFNQDGNVDSTDFFEFLTAYFSMSPDADVNYDGVITSQDFFDFLTAFFAGC